MNDMDLIDVRKKYIVAVSGGPDSMARLHMCITEKIDICVAHVNYRKRQSAFVEMEEVEKYCKQNNIPFYLLNEEYEYKGNFQSFARDYRYGFFYEIANKYKYGGVLIGHNEDDLIETYLMQKEKNLVTEVFGLSETNDYKGLKIYRPLLKYSKKELLEYCINNKVIYFIDESNLSDAYTRNRIRHEVVEKLSKEERIKIIEEIDLKNKNKKEIENKVLKHLDNKIDLDVFKSFNEEEQLSFIRIWFNKYIKTHSYSKSYLLQMVDILKSDKNIELEIYGKRFCKSYKVCEVVGKSENEYKFVIMSNEDMVTPYFQISNNGRKIEGISVQDDEWPLTIRNYKPNDTIKLKFGSKKINRWFIDRKIPSHLRKQWPIVLNNKNEVIMVPGIGCDINHYTIKPNIFVIK